jgi:serine/threonine protein kinase
MRISREHAELVLRNDRLHVRRLESARNAIYLGDSPSEEFTVGPGEEFRIGRTIFRLATRTCQPERLRGGDAAAEQEPAARFSQIALQSELERLQAILSRIDDDNETSSGASPSERSAPTPGASERVAPATQSIAAEATAFSDYELIDQLHRGATAQVLKARHRYLQRWASVHVLLSARATDELVARFRRKARLIAQFDHENLIRAFDAGQIEQTHYLITEFVDGWTLETAASCQLFELTFLLRVLIQAACGLAYAHEKKVVHRDVQPAHVLVARDGTVKLVGWGKSWCGGDWSLSQYEGPRHGIGAPEFTAPEQLADSRDVDERSDIYGLGRTLFAVLAAAAEARGTVVGERADQQSLAILELELPADLEQVYQKMVARDRDRRYQSMQDVVKALQKLV